MDGTVPGTQLLDGLPKSFTQHSNDKRKTDKQWLL